MKAGVLFPEEGAFQYIDFPEPQPQTPDEILVSVKAVAIKNLDRGIAQGRHYSSQASPGQGRVVGGDGICLLPDGTRVYGMGVSGMLAEKAVIHKDRIVPVPAGLSDATAAALPNAVAGAAMALKFKANIQPGDVVLINGATGVTGCMAVQLAKYYGAGKVIATGRNAKSLGDLPALGADVTISLLQEDKDLKTALAAEHAATPIDIVIDYLWGQSAELILSILKGNGSFTNPVNFVSVGSMSGDLIQLSAAILRSVDLRLTGSGLGSWSKTQVRQAFTEILPEAFQLAAEGKLKIDTTVVKLSETPGLWELEVPGGSRLVVLV